MEYLDPFVVGKSHRIMPWLITSWPAAISFNFWFYRGMKQPGRKSFLMGVAFTLAPVLISTVSVEKVPKAEYILLLIVQVIDSVMEADDWKRLLISFQIWSDWFCSIHEFSNGQASFVLLNLGVMANEFNKQSTRRVSASMRSGTIDSPSLSKFWSNSFVNMCSTIDVILPLNIYNKCAILIWFYVRLINYSIRWYKFIANYTLLRYCHDSKLLQRLMISNTFSTIEVPLNIIEDRNSGVDTRRSTSLNRKLLIISAA